MKKALFGLMAVLMLASASLVGCGPSATEQAVTQQNALLQQQIDAANAATAAANAENARLQQENKDLTTPRIIYPVVPPIYGPYVSPYYRYPGYWPGWAQPFYPGNWHWPFNRGPRPLPHGFPPGHSDGHPGGPY